MSLKKDDFDNLAKTTRKRVQNLRDVAKRAGIPHTEFYDTILTYMAPYGTHASATWIREQCDPDNTTPPTLRKLFALKQAIDQYIVTTPNPTTDAHLDDPDRNVPARSITAPTAVDLKPKTEVDLANHADTVEALGKTILEKPTRAVLTIATLLNNTLQTHTQKGGTLTPLITYLRTRVEFTHDIAISNMPIHTLRNVRTLEQAKTLNPSFKTLAALAHVLVTINTANFPWGDDDDLEQSIADMVAEKTNREPRAKKQKSLAEQNRELILRAQGTHVLERKLAKKT